MGFPFTPTLKTMSRTVRSKATKPTDSRRYRAQAVRLREAKKAVHAYGMVEDYTTEDHYCFEEWSNWREWQMLTSTIYDDGTLRLESELVPEDENHKTYIHLNLEACWGSTYVGIHIVGFSSVRRLLMAFKAWVRNLQREGVEHPLWFYPHTEDGKGKYRVNIYKKLGFTADLDDPEGLVLYLNT